jgi:ribonuclease HI
MCLGWLITKGIRRVAHGYGVVARCKNATSIVAEYLALIDGLQALIDMGAKRTPVRVIGDSKSVIYQMNGLSKVSSDRSMSIYLRALRLSGKLNIVDWNWVPRAENKAADMLTRRALKEFYADSQSYQRACQVLLRDRDQGSERLYNLGGMLVFQGGYQG